MVTQLKMGMVREPGIAHYICESCSEDWLHALGRQSWLHWTCIFYSFCLIHRLSVRSDEILDHPTKAKNLSKTLFLGRNTKKLFSLAMSYPIDTSPINEHTVSSANAEMEVLKVRSCLPRGEVQVSSFLSTARDLAFCCHSRTTFPVAIECADFKGDLIDFDWRHAQRKQAQKLLFRTVGVEGRFDDMDDFTRTVRMPGGYLSEGSSNDIDEIGKESREDDHQGRDPADLETKAETTKLLSPEENERMNVKIDRLIEVLESGRLVQFQQDPVTGDVDVAANYYDQRPERQSGQHGEHPFETTDSDPEADIYASPGFGNLISNRRDMLRSPTSVMFSWPSFESLPHTQYNNWEAAIEAANKRYERADLHGSSREVEASSAYDNSQSSESDGRNPVQEAATIHDAIRALEKDAGEPRGSRLVRVKSTAIQMDRIHPIPLEFNNRSKARTPSAHSADIELDRSSPLFMKSYQQVMKDSEDWITESSSHNTSDKPGVMDRVSAWLDQVEDPSSTSEVENEKGKAKAFDVLRDMPNAPGASELQNPGTQTSKILKDVSNLRRPGYLHHNSFAADVDAKTEVKAGTETKAPPLRWEPRPTISETRPSKIPVKRTTKTCEERPETSQAQEKSRERHATHSFKPLTSAHKAFSTDRFEGPDPLRDGRFEHALARLEGRAPPLSSTPIQRYVTPHSLYGSDVEVELRRVQCRQPSPIRHAVGNYTLAQTFEQMLRNGEDVGH